MTEAQLSREAIEEWIGDSWDELAAFAWDGYQEQGRGVCVILDKPCDGKACTGRCIGERNGKGLQLYREQLPSMMRDIEEGMKRYDPEREILVLYFGRERDNQLRASFHPVGAGEGLPTPPEACQQRRQTTH
jgi:hypothetical protein